jgi:hypothetical protein
MTPKRPARPAVSLGAIAAAVSLAGAAHAAPPTSVSDVQRVSEKVTVVSTDLATRRLVVRKASGETSTLKVPAEVRNLDQLKAGDTISATYTLEAEFALSPPNKPLPEDTQTVITARASRGELPAAVVANHIVVTGAVLGVDLQDHTVRVVSPQGGEVHTFAVTSPEGRKLISQLKPGDKVTAYVTESMLIAAERS